MLLLVNGKDIREINGDGLRKDLVMLRNLLLLYVVHVMVRRSVPYVPRPVDLVIHVQVHLSVL
jgi:hypothetical protein